MALFSRILKFDQNLTRQREQRTEQRYRPGRNFPLYATIESAEDPRNAKVLDLSHGGAGLQVAGPVYKVGDDAKLHLRLEELWMEFPCRIVHLKPLPVGCRLGLQAAFDKPETEQAFLQLLQPVILGSSMRPVAPEEVVQDDPTMHKLFFTGLPGTELSVWRRHDITGDLTAFLWRMDNYLVRGDDDVHVMQLCTRTQFQRSHRNKKAASPFGKLRQPLDGEVRQLFRWTMQDLPREVPGDIASFLQSFID